MTEDDSESAFDPMGFLTDIVTFHVVPNPEEITEISALLLDVSTIRLLGPFEVDDLENRIKRKKQSFTSSMGRSVNYAAKAVLPRASLQYRPVTCSQLLD